MSIFLIVIYMIGGPVVWVPLIAIPISIALTLLLEIPSKKSVQDTLSGSVQKQALLVETISGMETIKSLNAQNLMQKRWEHTVTKQLIYSPIFIPG